MGTATDVRYGLQKLSKFFEKRAKPLSISFLYFPDYFSNFAETKQAKGEFGSGPNDIKKLL